MSRGEAYDFIVVGAGAAGLLTARGLLRIGARVAIVEAAPAVAPGPSTRNGGFVHAGAFHSAVIPDLSRAHETAVRCREGHKRLTESFPEAVQTDGLPVFMLAQTEDVKARIAERWAAWGIEHESVDAVDLAREVPNLLVAKDTLVAVTTDVPFNWRLALQIVVSELKRTGCDVLTDHRVVAAAGKHLFVEHRGRRRRLRTSRIVYCAGYRSGELVSQVGHRWDVRPRVLLWKSHVLVVPRLTKHGVMYVDPGGVSAMPHGAFSLLCQSQEDTAVDEPDFSVDERRVEAIARAAWRAFPQEHAVLERGRAHACLKPTISLDESSVRRVDSQLLQVSESSWLALPGKATEAPLLADEVVRAVDIGGTAVDVTPRPFDGLRHEGPRRWSR